MSPAKSVPAQDLREAVPRLAERARAENWSHGEFLVACLQREVAARESHGGEGRIRVCQAGHRVLFATAAEWVTRLAEAHHAGRLEAELIRLAATRRWWSTRSATSRSSRSRQPVLPARVLPLRAGQPDRYV